MCTSEPDSDPASSLASCPAGKSLLGAGAAINGGSAERVVLDDVRPNDALTNVTATGLEGDDGYSPEWSVSAYAVCGSL